MTADVGSAYLSIVPSVAGLQRQLESQLSGIDLSKAGEKIGQTIGLGVQRSLSGIPIASNLAQQIEKATNEAQSCVQSKGAGLTLASDALGAVASVVTALASLKDVEWAKEAFSSLKKSLEAFNSEIVKSGGGIRGLVSMFAKFAGPVALVVTAIAALAAGFVYLMSTNEGFRDTVMGLVGTIGEELSPILQVVSQAIEYLGATVVPLLLSMLDLFLPVIGQIVLIILQVAAALAPIIAALVTQIVPIITIIIQLVTALAAEILVAIVPVISSILAIVQENMPMIQMIISTAMNAIMTVVQTVWPLIQAIIATAMAVIQSVINIVTAAMAGDWQGVWEGIKALVETVWAGIQNIVGIAIGILQDAINGALDFIQNIWHSGWAAIGNALQFAWDGICSAVESGVSAAVNAVGGLPDEALAALGDIGSYLRNAGSDFIQGFINGITAMGDFVINALRTLCNDALGAVKSFFGIASPSKVMAQMGGYIGEGLAEGIASSASSVVGAMNSVGEELVASATKTSSEVEQALAVQTDDMLEPFDSPMRNGSRQHVFASRESAYLPSADAKIDELIFAVRQLHMSLGGIIATNTPTMGRRDFRRVVNSL